MILDRDRLALAVARRQAAGETGVLTNGCFDLLHVGHLRALQQARALGDFLIVGLNTDAGVQRLKGPDRPLLPQDERAELLDALRCVDYVTFFDEPTALELAAQLAPRVYVKSEEYAAKPLPERAVVEAAGGRVVLVPIIEGRSTTQLMARIVALGSEAR
jgi:D-beta-D-heptose 7-phosphate kinase/D-beta-D-heptose 1-phosphate adenosyltransferase